MQAVYLIIGATGGIGKATVTRLAESGHSVVAAATKLDKLAQLETELSVETSQVDAMQFEQLDTLAANVVEKHGKIDGMVNCVGSILLKPAHLTTEEEWQKTLHLNLTTAFNVTKLAGKYMTQGGSVVLLSSGASLIGVPNHEAIAAAKGGINGLVLSAAATYAQRNLRFNAVAPGLVATPATQKMVENPTALKASISNHPLGRIGQPTDIASLIVWLLQPENSWITGQVIAVDGGLSTLRNRITL